MGGAANIVKRGVTAGLTGGLSEFAQRNPFGVPINNPLNPTPIPPTNYGGPFTISPEELAAQRASVEGLGKQQFDETNNFITGDQAARAAARRNLAESLTNQGQAVFQQSLPATEERLNAQHLLNGSGLGQEIARQQSNLATNIANTVGTLGANDIDLASQERAGALGAFHGMQTGGLQRQQSLEDLIRSANLAKQTGAALAPAPQQSGKAATGQFLQGVGSLAPLGAAIFGGPGAGMAAAAAPRVVANVMGQPVMNNQVSRQGGTGFLGGKF